MIHDEIMHTEMRDKWFSMTKQLSDQPRWSGIWKQYINDDVNEYVNDDVDTHDACYFLHDVTAERSGAIRLQY